jgi:kinesin family protein 18/19
MVGYRGQEGLMIRAVRAVFQQAADLASSRIYTIKMSYLEVYNETIRDLLVPKGCTTPLELRDDGVKGVVVSNLTEISPASTEDVLEFLSKGNANRSQCATDANGTSSRSHAVLTVLIEWRSRTADTSEVIRCSKLSLIDLAGSERASATKNKGSVLQEGANINKSLLSLGNCINALASGEKNQFVPYRNSKLTRLLKDSLGGNCKTVRPLFDDIPALLNATVVSFITSSYILVATLQVMIAAVSPSDACYEDTLNTLKCSPRASIRHM